MKYYVLASGSKGNCSVVESEGQFLIIDCGATKKYLKEAFQKIGIDYNEALALLITHEHSDHIKQVEMFSHLPIYAPCEIRSLPDEIFVEPYTPFVIGPFHITPIALSHDTDDTVGYIITDGIETLVQVTDTGYVSHQNEEMIRNADYYIFESNYDLMMLMRSARPAYLKSRINSDYGHLSNSQSSKVIANIIGPRTKEIVLAHISQECNTRQLAYDTLMDLLNDYGIDHSRYKIHAAGQFEIYAGGN